MNGQQKKEQYSGVRDREIRAALDRHWAASDANDFETEHRIYHEDAVLEYPQSGERTHGRSNIQNQRAIQPSKKRFAVRRIIGGGDLWITEFILTYDGKPSYTVSIMEFRGDKVARETQYFADPFVAPHGALNGSNTWTSLEAPEFQKVDRHLLFAGKLSRKPLGPD
jgi:ketosteroid isomerase-like protein